MDTPKHSVSVAAVITDDQGRALRIRRRDNGHWEPPGGVLELGETIEDGLRREVLEETGLEIDQGPLTGVYKNVVRDIVALVFRCKIASGELRINDEAAGFRWAGEAEVRALTTEAYAIRVIDGLGRGASAAIRHHDGTKVL